MERDIYFFFFSPLKFISMSSTRDEETQSLLRNSNPKRSNGKKVLITISAALVFLSVGVVGSLLHHDTFHSGTDEKIQFSINNSNIYRINLYSGKASALPHLVVGEKGAVAVELKECSDAGLSSKVNST